MRRITKLSTTTTSRGGARILLATAVACALAAGCSQTPTTPAAGGATAATTAASGVQGTPQTWQDFQARGWNCRTPNNGPVTVCSPPNQPLPIVAIPPAEPPADRPQTLLLKRWRDGIFEANVLLIRPEIYNGQLCEPTGQPYSYISVLGYFECAHLVGG